MSSSKHTKEKKKVRYETGTKPGHSHRSSRDSGVGSSSASDRASLGTANESPFSYQQIEDQRHTLSACQNALDAAVDKIRQLEAANASLNDLLAKSNKENRLLKKEKRDLLHQVDDLLGDLDDEKQVNERLRRAGSPRTGTAAAASAASTTKTSKSEKRPTPPPRRESNAFSQQHPFHDERMSHDPRAERAPPLSPVYNYAPPLARQPPHNTHPNPFMPRTTPSFTPAPVSVTYAPPTTLSYNPTPSYTITPHSQSNRHPPNDGKYHLQPL
jgi:hypothetical protein